MPSNLDNIHELLKQHYDEASEGLVDKPPSRLCRGEGTEKNFYILKIDLVNSTQLLLRRRKATYLKFAHTFLSTIDKITQNFGADPSQTEYAGDSVLAYFPENKASAEDVLTAACHSRAAVLGMQKLDGTLGGLKLQCKAALHFDSLIISNIGPRTDSLLTAIGFPLHRVAKIEKDIAADTGRATPQFYEKVTNPNKKFLKPIYSERQVPIPMPAYTPPPFGRPGLIAAPVRQTLLSDILAGRNQPVQPIPQYRSDKTLIGFDLKWLMLFSALKLLE